MRLLSETDTDSLEFVRRQEDPRAFELVSGSQTFGSLRWQKKCGSLAIAETAVGTWTLKRSGFLRTRITARRLDSGIDSSVFTPGWTGDGLLQFETGQQFRWARMGLWRPTWTFFDSTDAVALTFTANREGRSTGANVTIGESGKSSPMTPLLAIIGWYLILLANDDDEESAAIAAVIAAT